MIVEQYAFVPANGGVLARGGLLPHVDDDWQVASLKAVLPATNYLRVAAHVEVEPGHILRLRTFEAVDEPGTRPEEIEVPPPLRAAFDRCVAELRGAPIPELRPAWARPGWHAEVERWAGMPLEQVRSWPISAVLRGDGVYFKAVCPLFRHEPAITAALGSPRLLAADHDRGWMLMEALPPAEADHHAALRALAKVHRAWASRIAEALVLGARDRRSASELPHTLVHGDFHPGNVLGSTIIDWSDAAIANPLFDVNHYLLNAGDEDRDELVATYAEAWPEYDVAAAVAACEAETYEYIARSYALITDSLADEDEWWFADAESAWLRRASDVRAGRRPSPDT